MSICKSCGAEFESVRATAEADYPQECRLCAYSWTWAHDALMVIWNQMQKKYPNRVELHAHMIKMMNELEKEEC